MQGTRHNTITGEVTPARLTAKEQADMARVYQSMQERDAAKQAAIQSKMQRFERVFGDFTDEQRQLLAELLGAPQP